MGANRLGPHGLVVTRHVQDQRPAPILPQGLVSDGAGFGCHLRSRLTLGCTHTLLTTLGLFILKTKSFFNRPPKKVNQRML